MCVAYINFRLNTSCAHCVHRHRRRRLQCFHVERYIRQFPIKPNAERHRQ